MVFFIQANAIPDCSDMALFSTLLADCRIRFLFCCFMRGYLRGGFFIQKSEVRGRKSEVRRIERPKSQKVPKTISVL